MKEQIKQMFHDEIYLQVKISRDKLKRELEDLNRQATEVQTRLVQTEALLDEIVKFKEVVFK